MTAYGWGQAAETIAAWWLRLKGYRIVARRLRGRRGSGVGELDLVARRQSVLAFVEVKARPDLATAAQALTPAQRQRLVRAAEAFLARHPQWGHLQPRFDLILVAPWRRPRHIPDAWQA